MIPFDLIYVMCWPTVEGGGTVGKYWVVVVRWLGNGDNSVMNHVEIIPKLCVIYIQTFHIKDMRQITHSQIHQLSFET